MLEDFVDSIREYYSDDIDHWTLEDRRVPESIGRLPCDYRDSLRLPALLGITLGKAIE